MPVPLNDLSRIDSSIREEIIERVGEVISSGNYILGPELEKFEAELATFLGCEETVGVANGTDALILSLLAADVRSGDVVMTMANAGAYTTVAARAIGAEPVFVDVSPDSLQMTLANLRESYSLTQKLGLSPKVIVVTHLFGQLNSEISEISMFAKAKGVVLIEDCAQAIGASQDSKMAGSYGSLSTFSFFPTKNLGASGDAGGVAGKEVAMLSKVRKLRQYGWGQKYSIELAGGRNSRLDETQAAILRAKLPYVTSWNQRRREIFSQYIDSANKRVKFYSTPDDSFVGHLCPISVEGISQSQLTEHFASLGVSTGIHFPVPDHLQQIPLKYRNLVPLPTTENSCSSHVTIPLFPELTVEEIEIVCTALRELGN
jgi:dTDP-4-amino-4,6-dideoxygalactose transaminase